MIPNPILKVLSTLSCHGVRHLLMGGQACVFYGAAEFSRDCDIVVEPDSENLKCLDSALAELQAQCIALPPHDWSYLARGHAIHFRCQHPEAVEMRLDVMARMRGCDEFAKLWERCTTVVDADNTTLELLGIEDLIKAKKTQRDKDWPMIQRLVDAHYEEFRDEPTDERVRFWLRESRNPLVLISLVAQHPAIAKELFQVRRLLAEALAASSRAITTGLRDEQAAERAKDESYWNPLKRELQQLRANQRRPSE